MTGRYRRGGENQPRQFRVASKPGLHFNAGMSRQWSKLFRSCVAPEVAMRRWRELTGSLTSDAFIESELHAHAVITTLSASEFFFDLLKSHPCWTLDVLAPENLAHARRVEGTRRELNLKLAALPEDATDTQRFDIVREFKNRELLRIGARDLLRLAGVPEITRELSDLADVCLQSVLGILLSGLEARVGIPHHQDAKGRWQPTSWCVIALGKLGGQELNFSSDVDLMFIYQEDGALRAPEKRRRSPARSTLSNHEFFTKFTESFASEMQRLSPSGNLYRLDLRLRPEGETGPLARSLASCESYYAQWGQGWERLMLLKARCVAGDARLGAEFIEAIQPFRYPRLMDDGLIRDVADNKQRLETEVIAPGDRGRDIKRGPGGIREIEFVVQTLQVLHGGRQPFLQDHQTLHAIEKLARYRFLRPGEAKALTRAYVFLRDVEHRLQMEADAQTHALPEDSARTAQLARLMGFATTAQFRAALARHRRAVRRVYGRFIGAPGPSSASHEPPPPAELAAAGFREPDRAARLLKRFVDGPGYALVSRRTTELGLQLVQSLLHHCPSRSSGRWIRALSDPDRVLARLDSFVERYGARATLYELWTRNPALFELWLWLFDRSEHLSSMAIQTPDLVEHLQLSGQLMRLKTSDIHLRELHEGEGDANQHRWLRRYGQAEQMRIGLRDILGLSTDGQHRGELTALATATLQYALDALFRRHGKPRAPVAIIGLGKLGGGELDYGSDLDILLVTEVPAKRLGALQTIATGLISLLSERTADGGLFNVDLRLRPDGEKGLLVTTPAACADYYTRRAQLWEIQSLTRAGFVAGDADVGGRFIEWITRLADFSRPRPDLACWTPAWRGEIHSMRQRIERERTPPGQDSLAIKTGSGGLMDAEFIAQALCLAHGWHEPNTLTALQRAARERAIPARLAQRLITGSSELRRIESILRRWSFEGEVLLPDDPAALQRVAVRCGFRDASLFLRHIGRIRAAIRRVYELILPA